MGCGAGNAGMGTGGWDGSVAGLGDGWLSE